MNKNEKEHLGWQYVGLNQTFGPIAARHYDEKNEFKDGTTKTHVFIMTIVPDKYLYKDDI